MKLRTLFGSLCGALLASCSGGDGAVRMTQWESPEGTAAELREGKLSLSAGSRFSFFGPGSRDGFRNFTFEALVRTEQDGRAGLFFHTDDTGKGYEVLLAGGPADGSRKTGSLSRVRNLYKNIVPDGRWFPLTVSVRGRNITVEVDTVTVVCYTEPDAPYRLPEYASRLLGSGNFALAGYAGTVELKDMRVTVLPDNAVNRADTLGAKPETDDPIIRLQQRNFPVIDYHVHLKGWNKEQAHARSMYCGIDYGIAPNCGIGFPITSDAEVAAYCDSTQNMPFFFGMQGEGREWPHTFSAASRARFDYVFTDALTFTDHKGRRTRLWIPEEVFIDIPEEEYMEVIVDRTLKVLREEPIDIYVNPCLLPDSMMPRYDRLWTSKRMQKVVDALQERGIVLEINARYRVPNFAFIRMAKEAGLKFTFGTNNATPDIGELEYCIEAIDSCGITAADIWFPSERRLR